ncbi:serine hydrolase [Tessaracoccus timonensis]|uniref:serine hydrolase n=1 Tax=Tessaracoccus timonensis TaxID=2161816 RepID=UPI0018D51684|nr:serine hydrolase [Tessaracoccus timonensis]
MNDDSWRSSTARVEGPPSVSYALLDASGASLASRGEKQRYYAASTIKLHIMLAVLQKVEAGELGLDDVLTATRTFVGCDGRPFTLTGDHLHPEFPEEGAPLTVEQAVYLMISRSSNEATNMCLALLSGFPKVIADVCRRLNLVGTKVERQIGDAVAVARGLTNETCAIDLASTMHAIRYDDFLSEETQGVALAALRDQQMPVITRAVSDAVDYGSKSGEIPGIRHDVAFIGETGLSLAVMTSGMGEAEANETIEALAMALLSVKRQDG